MYDHPVTRGGADTKRLALQIWCNKEQIAIQVWRHKWFNFALVGWLYFKGVAGSYAALHLLLLGTPGGEYILFLSCFYLLVAGARHKEIFIDRIPPPQ